MGDTNYISGIVKILENPIERTFNKNISITQFRVQLPQIRNNIIVNLVFWGKLSQDITNYYKINDYIIIEGYLSLRDKKKLENSRSVEITVLKVYPFILSDNRQINRL
jgi:hypothetical protein